MNIAESPTSMSTRAAVILSKLKKFGANPGRLKARYYVPDDLARSAALVVALHGSQQSADDYANGAGWAHYAKQHGFALLLPEQKRENNPSRSFNWFGSNDNRRAGGEAQSIREMIESLVEKHRLDPGNVFITGLSAGGAMALVMMATYPEVFAGGAVIAGLPYGCARGVLQAIDRMHGLGGPTAAAMEATVRSASTHDGPWPTLSLWHGSADRTVNIGNVDAILAQWSALHGLPPEPTREDLVEGYPRRVWADASGREVVEVYSITGMGHGTPIEAMGEDGAGVAGSFMLDVHISSTRHIARFWGLAPLTPLVLPLPPTVSVNGSHANPNGSAIDIATPPLGMQTADAAQDDGGVEPKALDPTICDARTSGTARPPLLQAWQVQADLAVRMMLAASTPWWWQWINLPRRTNAGWIPGRRNERQGEGRTPRS